MTGARPEISVLVEYRCVDCEHRFYLGDDDDDSSNVCPFCASTEVMFVRSYDVSLRGQNGDS